jgi:hypothetical protein
MAHGSLLSTTKTPAAAAPGRTHGRTLRKADRRHYQSQEQKPSFSHEY